MDNAFDLAGVHEVAVALRAGADLVHDAVAQARAALDGACYDCEAARRQRAELASIAGDAEAHSLALLELAASLVRWPLTAGGAG